MSLKLNEEQKLAMLRKTFAYVQDLTRLQTEKEYILGRIAISKGDPDEAKLREVARILSDSMLQGYSSMLVGAGMLLDDRLTREAEQAAKDAEGTESDDS